MSHETQDDEHNAAKLTARDLLDAFEKVHRAMVAARRHGTTEEHLAAAAEMVHTVRKMDASRADTPSGLLGLFKHGK